MSSARVGRALVALGASRSSWIRSGPSWHLARVCSVSTRRGVHVHRRSHVRRPRIAIITCVSAVDELSVEDTRDDAAIGSLVPAAWDPRLEDTSDDAGRGRRAGPIAIEGFRRGSRSRLMPSDARRFPGDDDFSRLARAVCEAHVLPRKELYETWEAALVITRAFEDEPAGLPSRVVDVAGGHGLLALALLVLNPPRHHLSDVEPRSALIVDKRKPESFETLYRHVTATWPHVHGRVRFVEASAEGAACSRDVLLVSVHACGALTDLVLRLAADNGSPVAVVPCCHRGLGSAKTLATRIGSEGITASVVMDAARAANLGRRGYDVEAFALPRQITPQNRVIVGKPNGAWIRQSTKYGTLLAGTGAGAGAGGDGDGDGGADETEENTGEDGGGRGWASLEETLPESPWRRYG